MIYLFFLLTFHFSGAEKMVCKETLHQTEFLRKSKSDTLKFTSGIRAILQDRNGHYWIGSHSEGVCYYDGHSFQYFDRKSGLPDNQVRSIDEDKTGKIWFGTANGIGSYDGQIMRNHTLFVPGLVGKQWKKTENDIWITAGEKAGVYRYDGRQLDYLVLPPLPNKKHGWSYLVTGIAHGAGNRTWVGTYSAAVAYNGSFFTIINDEALGLDEKTGYLHIRSILEDSKGRLWIGNNGIGVLLKEEGSTINFSEQHNLIHRESSKSGKKSPAGTLEHVFAIAEDKDGNIWFGDRDTGVWKYDGQSMTNYVNDKEAANPMVWTIYVTQDNEILIGKANGRVYSLNGRNFERKF